MRAYPIILGTAGHIDHGKTALVRSLTGIDTDRLKVEKERGITTELGFAHLDVEGRRFGVIDVPGHERFIKAMVAGAAGLDLVCLVIAADEGIMPQTREHLDICELLGVRRGVVALSKRDLVDDDWLEMVTADVREGLAESFLADAPIVPVSVVSGAGQDELLRALVAATDDLPARSPEGSFRLPIDRVFTIKGFGTVVTGTVLSGTVSVGDDVSLVPRGERAKVRGLEVHGESTDEARAGVRCAINLTGVSTEEIERGDVLVHQEAIAASHIIDARFRYLPTSRGTLKARTRVLLHHGTTQRLASLVLVDRHELAPGEEALVQLRLDASCALAALPGDHFIARGFVVQEHYGTTIGGGEIVRVQAPKVRRHSDAAAEMVAAVARADADQRVALEVRASRSAGATVTDLMKSLGQSSAELEDALARLVESGELVCAGSGTGAVYAHALEVAGLEKIAADAIAEFHRVHPQKRGIPKAELRGELPRSTPGKIFEEVLDALVRRGAAELDRDIVRKPGKGSARSPLEKKISDAFRDWGNTPERPKNVASRLGEDPGEVGRALERLLTSGVLVKVRPDLYLHAEPLGSLRTRLLAHLDERGQISPAEWKEITGASRKFSIPLAEYFDKEKLTLRVGDVRKRRG